MLNALQNALTITLALHSGRHRKCRHLGGFGLRVGVERRAGKNDAVVLDDGVIFACAALYPYPEAKTAEMAALTVSPAVQGQGDGERVLKRIEQRAKAAGLDSIFVLTTRTMHWFIKRGFAQVDPDWLPEARKRKYNWDRKSQVLVKKLL